MEVLSGFINKQRITSFLVSILIWSFTFAGNSERASLAQRLGYSDDAKLLIVHADDLGVAHSVNRATLDAMSKKREVHSNEPVGGRIDNTIAVNSGSIMVPCAWFPEIAAYYRANPELDLGLHLTLTSEWKHYRWSGVLTDQAASSLHNEDGFLYASVEEVVQFASVAAVEREINAQVERALQFGIRPTHLDSHMGTLFQTPGFFSAYLELGRKYNLPVLLPAESLEAAPPQLRELISEKDILIDRFVMAGPDVPVDKWEKYYSDVLRTLKPGVTEIIIHAGYDNAELRAVTIEHPDYGAAWREADYQFFTSDMFRTLVKQHDIQLITWREIGKLLGRPE